MFSPCRDVFFFVCSNDNRCATTNTQRFTGLLASCIEHLSASLLGLALGIMQDFSEQKATICRYPSARLFFYHGTDRTESLARLFGTGTARHQNKGFPDGYSLVSWAGHGCSFSALNSKEFFLLWISFNFLVTKLVLRVYCRRGRTDGLLATLVLGKLPCVFFFWLPLV